MRSYRTYVIILGLAAGSLLGTRSTNAAGPFFVDCKCANNSHEVGKGATLTAALNDAKSKCTTNDGGVINPAASCFTLRCAGGTDDGELCQDGTTCDSATCESSEAAAGACCKYADNTCTEISEAECKDLSKGYVYRGGGAICGEDGQCIPTLSEWGVAVMAMLVLTAGTIVVMRRRAAVA